MRKTLIAGIAAAALAVTVAASPANAAQTTITGSGSSFAGNLLSKATSIYTAGKVTYTPSSSGDGRTAFKNGVDAFAMSDSTYASGTAPSAFTYIPVAGGPVVFAYNSTNKFKGADGKQHYMPKNLKITPQVASDILTGVIKKWNDPRIKALNPKAYLPTAKIRPYYRNNNSGTSKNLVTYFTKNGVTGWKSTISGTIQNDVASGTMAGYGTDKSATIAKSVKNDAFGFGYFDLSDAATVPVNKFLLQNKLGQFVAPSVTAGQKFLERFDANSDGTVTLDFAKPIPGAYQLTILTYAVAATTGANPSQDAAKRAAVKSFLTYLVTNKTVRAWEASHGYVPLTLGVYNTAQDKIALISTN